MYKIGENIHIIAPKVKQALADRDGAFFVDLARKQQAAGADVLDLNIGPQKKAGPEVVDWLVDVIQEAVPGMTISLDTTNLAAIEAGLKKIGSNSIINSTSAEEERLANVPPLAARYGSKLIALCMEKSGIPVSADARVGLAMEKLIPRAQEVGIPMANLLVDPLILTVSGCQEYVPQAIETVRMVKMVMDPAPMTVVGQPGPGGDASADQPGVHGDADGRRARRRHPRSARYRPDGRHPAGRGPRRPHAAGCPVPQAVRRRGRRRRTAARGRGPFRPETGRSLEDGPGPAQQGHLY
jgi:5-methyltetrahydrofolate corrinoid/iron sulfur protein methyltransferase